jgi:hypothetical protein
MIALTTRNHAITPRLTAFEMKLPSELNGGLCGFGATRGEIDPAAGAKVWRGERKEAVG